MTTIKNIIDGPVPTGIIIIGDEMEGAKPFLTRTLGNRLARRVLFFIREDLLNEGKGCFQGALWFPKRPRNRGGFLRFFLDYLGLPNISELYPSRHFFFMLYG